MKVLNFSNVLSAATDVATKITHSQFQPDYLIGIATGSLYPLALLSKELGNKNILTITASSEKVNNQKQVTVSYYPNVDLTGKNILLIDDITDSGQTLETLSNLILDHYQAKEVKTATLGANMDNSIILPDFFALEEKGKWLKFPWEKEQFSAYPY